MELKERNYRLDNLKLLLIFFVLFGHRLELFTLSNPALYNIYLLIYSFHMPLFIFITGITAKFSKRRVFELGFCYLVMQTIYQFTNVYFESGYDAAINAMTYAKPYWLLWYLFTILVYTILIPVINFKNGYIRLGIIAISVAMCLLAGLDKNIGYNLSMSRILVFLPFFISGFYMKDYIDKVEKWLKNPKIRYTILAVSFIAVILISYLIWTSNFIRKEMLYGSYSYKKLDYNAGWRMAFLLIAIVWLVFFYTLIPNYRVPFLTCLGANTYTIYLFHGFIIKLSFGTLSLGINIVTTILFVIGLILVLGNKYVAKCLRFICCGDGILYIYDRIKNRIKENNLKETS